MKNEEVGVSTENGVSGLIPCKAKVYLKSGKYRERGREAVSAAEWCYKIGASCSGPACGVHTYRHKAVSLTGVGEASQGLSLRVWEGDQVSKQ